MRQGSGSALVQVKACRLFGAKPLPEPMLAFCQLDSWEQISTGILSFSFKKIHLKMSSVSMAVILSRGRWVKLQWHDCMLYGTLKRLMWYAIFILHYDIMTLNRFPQYWSFVRGLTVDSPYKGASDAELWCFLLNKKSSCRWFETP